MRVSGSFSFEWLCGLQVLQAGRARSLGDGKKMPGRENQEMKSLLVASAGGHLEELWLLRPRLGELGQDVTWVTWDTPQSRSLLRGERRIFVRFPRPRDARATLAIARLASHVLSLGGWSDVISTGSLPAVPFLTLARLRGIRAHFIESAARVDGPSLSARILERTPGVHRYAQYRTWDRRSWQYRGSVFDSFAPGADRPTALRRVVVTVGSSRYDFRRALAAVRAVLPRQAEVVWQTGASDVSGLGIAARPYLPAGELSAAMAAADLVVAHAGVGSALSAMGAGHCPLLIPRRRAHGEHVDDHQLQVAAELASRGLALVTEPEDLDRRLLLAAAARRVDVHRAPPPFRLESA